VADASNAGATMAMASGELSKSAMLRAPRAVGENSDLKSFSAREAVVITVH
jgi:hypothetical protein